MNEAISRAFQIAMFNRRAARQVSLDTSATGDAVLLVAAIEAFVALAFAVGQGGFSLSIFVESVILGVASWLIHSAAIWLMGTKLLKGSASIDAMFRASGFARLPLLLAAIDAFVGGRLFGQIGLVWYLALLVIVTGVALGIDWKEALGAVVLGTAVVLLLQLIFRTSFFRI
jgi:hypothetical protein